MKKKLNIAKECEAHIALKAKEKENLLPALYPKMYTTQEGWYLVEIKCLENDFRRGGTRIRYSNWNEVFADCEMQAFLSACKLAEKKGLIVDCVPEESEIIFYGVWADEAARGLNIIIPRFPRGSRRVTTVSSLF